jgi:hypothetical protein
MDPSALNYNTDAEIDNGSCSYEITGNIVGCIDPLALNYNPENSSAIFTQRSLLIEMLLSKLIFL